MVCRFDRIRYPFFVAKLATRKSVQNPNCCVTKYEGLMRSQNVEYLLQRWLKQLFQSLCRARRTVLIHFENKATTRRTFPRQHRLSMKEKSQFGSINFTRPYSDNKSWQPNLTRWKKKRPVNDVLYRRVNAADWLVFLSCDRWHDAFILWRRRWWVFSACQLFHLWFRCFPQRFALGTFLLST